MTEPATCNRCGREWARDPVLEVPCPKCGAPVGQRCKDRAPSGHVKSQGFGNLPPWGHDERDLLANAEGHYDHPCVRARPVTAPTRATQQEMFA